MSRRQRLTGLPQAAVPPAHNVPLCSALSRCVAGNTYWQDCVTRSLGLVVDCVRMFDRFLQAAAAAGGSAAGAGGAPDTAEHGAAQGAGQRLERSRAKRDAGEHQKAAAAAATQLTIASLAALQYGCSAVDH